MKENAIKTKSFAFSLRMVKLYKILLQDKKEFVLSRQLLRSGTAIGALIREAEHAESRADFIHKMAIAQKEANETEYWLDLLFFSEFLSQEEFKLFKNEIMELKKILSSIIITSKNNLKTKK